MTMPTALIKDDFNNLLEYQSWLGEKWNSLSSLNVSFKERYKREKIERAIRTMPDWFGSDVTWEELSEGVTQYKDPALIEELYNKVNNSISTDIIYKIKKRKLDFNAIGVGVFCFDRAAMTLYRAKTPNGKTKVRTATKELFAWFPQESRDRHAVEMFISCDAPASAEAKQMLYGGISAIIMAELLVKAGVKVKMNIVIGSAVAESRELYIGCVIPVKEFEQSFDRNLIALLTSDPRFMRFDAFKGVIAAFDHFKRKTPEGMGFATNAAQLKTLFEESGYTEKSQAQHRYYFGGTLSQDQAIRDIDLTITDLAAKLGQK